MYLGAFSGNSSAISSIEPSSSSSTAMDSDFLSILTERALVTLDDLKRNFCVEATQEMVGGVVS
jgi:hypothetical protein